jgi:hypothetical protein
MTIAFSKLASSIIFDNVSTKQIKVAYTRLTDLMKWSLISPKKCSLDFVVDKTITE